MLLAVGVLAVAGLGARLAARRGSEGTAPRSPRALDRRAIAFREDAEPARVVADVEAVLEAAADGVRCVVRASATGPRVHGAPGPLGVHGGNRITAEELATLLARDGVALRIRGVATRGPAPDVTRGRVLERRIGPDGRVTHVPAGPDDAAVAAAWTSAPLLDGTSTLEVVADGRVRVRCVVRVGDGTARIVRFAQVDEHGEEVGS